MKYFKKGLAVFITLMGSVCLFSCHKDETPSKTEPEPTQTENNVTMDRFNVKAKDEAFLGDTYKILDVVARDSSGKEYIPTVEVMCDGSKVTVTNNQFTVEKLKNYEISYKISFNGKDIIKKTIVEVKDNLGPKLVIGEFKESVALNEEVAIPAITVTDNSGATITPTVKVLFKDTAEEVAVANGKFKASKLGYYTIKIEAKDAANNKTAKELIVVVRGENEIEGFDSKNFVETIGNIGTPNGASISYNSDKNYVLQGEGSLKFTSGSEHVKGSFPEINIAKPAIKDISGKHSLSFAVYNANPVPAEINLCDRNDGWTKIAPYSWGIVRFNTDSPVLSGKNWKDNPTAGAKDLTNLVIYFKQTTTEPMTFYIDNLRAHDSEAEDHIGELTPIGSIKAGTEFTIPVYNSDSKISTYLVNKTNGVRRAITAENNKLSINEEGRYSVEYIYQNGFDTEVKYNDFSIMKEKVKPALVIDDFENNPDLYWECTSQVQMNVSSEHAIDGKQSLEFVVDIDDGYPRMACSKKVLEKYVDVYDYVTFRIFNGGSKIHKINCNDYELPELKPGLNEITLTNKEFKDIVNGDVAANGVDSGVYKLGLVTFFPFNIESSNEAFSLFFDSFTGGYNDIDAGCNEAVDFNKEFNGYTFSKIEATVGDQKVNAVDGKLTFTNEGTYDVTLTGKREGTDESTFTIKVKVTDLSKPEITLGDYETKGYTNEAYVLPTVTITDNLDKDLTPTFKVLFGEEEIAVAENKFTPTKEGTYKIIISTVDSNGNEASVEYEITVKAPHIMDAITMEDFEDNPAEYYVSRNSSTLANSAEHTLDGKQSLEIKVNKDEEWLIVYTDKQRFSAYIDKFDYVVLNMYSTGSVKHRLFINEIKFDDLKPGENRIVIDNETFKKAINNDEAMASKYPTMYIKDMTTFVFDTQTVGDYNEDEFSIFFDSFTGGYNDIDTVCNTEIDFNTELPGFTFDSIKATLGEDVLAATDGKIKFVKPGTYTVELTGKREGTNPATFTVKVNVVDNSKPEITLGDHKTNGFVNDEYVLPEITVTDNIDKNLTPTIKVLFGEEEITVAENKFTPANEGTYKVIVSVVDSNGNEASVEYEIVIKERVAKDALTIEHFENDPLSFASANDNTKVSVTDQNVLDGKQALQFTIDQWDGYPKLYLDKELFVPYLDKFDYVELNLYSTGANDHSTWINNISLGTLKNGLNTFKLTNDEFKAMVNGDVAAHEAESGIYEVGKLGFFVNCEAPTNEGFNIIFDKFVGGFNDIDTVCNTEIDFNTELPGFTFSSIKATLGEDVLEAKDGKISFVNAGTYTVELTGNREGTLPATFTIKVNVVDNSKPEITVGEHEAKTTVNEEYVLPQITITDNIDKDLTPTFKVLFGEEEITVAENKFTPTKEGAYKVIVSTVDTSGNETSVEFTITAILPYQANALTINDFEAGVGNYYSDPNITLAASAEHAVNGKQSLEATFTDAAGYNWIRTEKSEFTKYFDLYDYVVLHMYSTGKLEHRMWINETRLPNLKPGLNRIVLTNERFKQCVNNDEIAFGIDKNLYEVGKTAFSFDNQNANEGFKVYFDAFEGGYNLRADINKEFDLNKALPGYTISSVKATMGETTLESTNGKLTFTETGKYELAINGKRGDESESRFYLELTAGQFALDFEEDADKSSMTPEHVGASEISTMYSTSGNSSFRMYNLPADYPQFGISDSITNASDMEYIEFDILLTTTEINRFVRKGELKFWGGGWGPDQKLYSEVTTNEWHTVTIAKSVLEAEIAAGHNLFYFVTFNVGSGDNDITDPSLEMFVDCVRYSKVATGDLVIK